MKTREADLVRDYTDRAQAFGITVTETYRDPGLNRMFKWTKDGSENVSNITNFGEMVRNAERQKALAEYLARGGTVRTFDPDVAIGMSKTKYVGRKAPGGGRKAEPIQTGDKKFDMYLNALPEPVRVLVVPLGWDPRELYKEYRALKKEGLIAKYATDENKAAAASKEGA